MMHSWHPEKKSRATHAPGLRSSHNALQTAVRLAEHCSSEILGKCSHFSATSLRYSSESAVARGDKRILMWINLASDVDVERTLDLSDYRAAPSETGLCKVPLAQRHNVSISIRTGDWSPWAFLGSITPDKKP